MKGTGGFGSWGRMETIQTTALMRNGQNTEKNLGELRRLAVTKIPVKNHQLTLLWKPLKNKNKKNNSNNNNKNKCTDISSDKTNEISH